MAFYVNPRPSRQSTYGLNAGPLLTDVGVTVVEVTDLGDTGAGTLRDAVDNAADNTIINFGVSGNIDLADGLSRTATFGSGINNLWIRGESAPGPVTIRNLGMFFFGCTDIHISNLRFECGTKYAGGVIDDFTLVAGTKYETAKFQRERF